MAPPPPQPKFDYSPKPIAWTEKRAIEALGPGSKNTVVHLFRRAKDVVEQHKLWPNQFGGAQMALVETRNTRASQLAREFGDSINVAGHPSFAKQLAYGVLLCASSLDVSSAVESESQGSVHPAMTLSTPSQTPISPFSSLGAARSPWEALALLNLRSTFFLRGRGLSSHTKCSQGTSWKHRRWLEHLFFRRLWLDLKQYECVDDSLQQILKYSFDDFASRFPITDNLQLRRAVTSHKNKGIQAIAIKPISPEELRESPVCRLLEYAD